MACLIAFVLAARQIETARHRTNVIDVNAALLVAFVAAATAFFRAAFLAACIVRTCQ